MEKIKRERTAGQSLKRKEGKLERVEGLGNHFVPPSGKKGRVSLETNKSEEKESKKRT